MSASALPTLSPTHGPTIGGNWATLAGGQFAVAGTQVTVDGIAISPDSLRLDSIDDALSFLVPAGRRAGTVEIQITRSDGKRLNLTYEYEPPIVDNLAFTGFAYLAGVVLWAAMMLVIGLAFLGVSRVRRRTYA